MDVNGPAGRPVGEPHSQKAGGFPAKGLPVQEVAPAADALPDEKAQADQIQQSQDVQLLHPAENQSADDRADDAAVNGQSALPNVQAGDGVGGILLPGKDAIIGPGANDGKGGRPQDPVDEMVLRDAELSAPAAGLPQRQGQAQRKNLLELHFFFNLQSDA